MSGIFTFQLTDDNDDVVEVVADSRDVLAWEKEAAQNTYMSQLQDMNMTALYRIAFKAAKRTDAYTGSLKDFETTYQLVVLEKNPLKQQDPTNGDPSTET